MIPIYIEFTSPKNKILPIYSWLIRLVEKTPYSHVRLRWCSKAGEELIYEAGGSSVRVIGKEAQNKHPVKVIYSYCVWITDEQYKGLIRLFRYAGVDYGVKQVFGIALMRLFSLRRNPFADGRKSQVCAELVGLFFKEVLKYPLHLDLDSAGVKDINVLVKYYLASFQLSLSPPSQS